MGRIGLIAAVVTCLVVASIFGISLAQSSPSGPVEVLTRGDAGLVLRVRAHSAATLPAMPGGSGSCARLSHRSDDQRYLCPRSTVAVVIDRSSSRVAVVPSQAPRRSAWYELLMGDWFVAVLSGGLIAMAANWLGSLRDRRRTNERLRIEMVRAVLAWRRSLPSDEDRLEVLASGLVPGVLRRSEQKRLRHALLAGNREDATRIITKALGLPA